MENDIQRWLQKGLIDKKTSEKLLEDIKSEKSQNSKIRFNIFIYTLAAICIGIGIVAFITANDWIIKLFNRKPIIRIISLFIMSILSLFSGYIFAYKKKNFPKLGRSLIFLSSILIGATYILVWKTYDIKNHFDVLMLIWLFSILPIAYIFKDIATNILSIFVFFIASFLTKWNGMGDEWYNCAVIIPLISGAFLYTIGNTNTISNYCDDFSSAYKISGVTAIFLALLYLAVGEKTENPIDLYLSVPLIALLICNLFSYCMLVRSNNDGDTFKKTDALLLSSVLLTVIIVSIFPQIIHFSVAIVLANILIIAIVGEGFRRGYRFNLYNVIGLMNTFTVMYIVANYCIWGWNSMENATFFTSGGIALLIIGIFLERNRKNIMKKKKWKLQ